MNGLLVWVGRLWRKVVDTIQESVGGWAVVFLG